MIAAKNPTVGTDRHPTPPEQGKRARRTGSPGSRTISCSTGSAVAKALCTCQPISIGANSSPTYTKQNVAGNSYVDNGHKLRAFGAGKTAS